MITKVGMAPVRENLGTTKFSKTFCSVISEDDTEMMIYWDLVALSSAWVICISWQLGYLYIELGLIGADEFRGL